MAVLPSPQLGFGAGGGQDLSGLPDILPADTLVIGPTQKVLTTPSHLAGGGGSGGDGGPVGYAT